jgi:hypothetical protein
MVQNQNPESSTYMLLLFVSSVFNNFYLFTGLEQDIT